jgi:hypothetical protein
MLFLRETGGAVISLLRSAIAELNTKMISLAVDTENGNDTDAIIDLIADFDDTIRVI